MSPSTFHKALLAVMAVLLLTLTVTAQSASSVSADSSASLASSSAVASSGSLASSSAPVITTVGPCRVRYCAVCATGTDVRCATCANGYKVNQINGYCVLRCRVNNCLSCQLNNNAWCLQCASGYTRLNNGLCGRSRPTIIITHGAMAPVSLVIAAGATLLSAVALML